MKKILYSLVIVLIFAFTPKVFAATFEGNGRDLKYFDSNNMWVNFASASSFNGYNVAWNSEYGAYYTNSSIITGNFGGGFAGTITLVPGQYYNILYVTSSPSSGTANSCGAPNNWNSQFKASSAINSNSTQRAVVDRSFVSKGYVTYTVQDDYFDACYYAVTFHVTDVTTTLILPFNSNGSYNGTWVFYGFNLENLGSIDSLSSQDLTNMQTQLQNSINTMSSNITNNANTNTQNIINNQNANQAQNHQDSVNTQNKIDDLNDSITDDNVNSNTGKSFFDNFSDNTHGLSGIITAPLNIIRQLINVNPTSCSALSTTYHGKTISMECGQIFWGHTGFNEFNVFYNMVVGGAFCYLIIKDLFLTIEKLKDPDNDKVEVMDL